MIHTNMPRNCTTFLLVRELTGSAILWSQKFDSQNGMPCYSRCIRKTLGFQDIFVWIILGKICSGQVARRALPIVAKTLSIAIISSSMSRDGSFLAIAGIAAFSYFP